MSHSHAHGKAKWFTEPEDPWRLWLAALLSTALISAAPFFILFFIPLDNAQEHESLLKTLLSFASGGLLGDAFLHLIPHALSPHHAHAEDGHSHVHDHHDHHHEHHDHHDHHHHAHDHHHHAHDHTQEMSVGLWVLAGIVAFLLVEKMVRVMKGEGHAHGHSHTHKEKTEKDQQGKKKDKEECKILCENLSCFISTLIIMMWLLYKVFHVSYCMEKFGEELLLQEFFTSTKSPMVHPL